VAYRVRIASILPISITNLVFFALQIPIQGPLAVDPTEQVRDFGLTVYEATERQFDGSLLGGAVVCQDIS